MFQVISVNAHISTEIAEMVEATIEGQKPE
jgi:hypothetical protein